MKCAAYYKKVRSVFYVEEFGMKKIIIGLVCSFGIGQLSCPMDTTFASFKDALLGKKRDLIEEIDSAKSDTSLSPAVRARKLAKLYAELRNKYRGKEEYSEYSELMVRYAKTAKELERQEREIAYQLEEKNIRTAKEGQLNEQLKKISSASIDPLAKCEARFKCYSQLMALFDGINKEKYNLYEASRDNVTQKKTLLSLKASLEQTSDKSQQVETLRAISKLCKKPARAQRYMQRAEVLEQEIYQEELTVKYNDILQMISQTSDPAQIAKLYRILMYYSDAHAQENLALAKQYEEQAEKEQQERLLIVDRTGKIVGLTMEIERTAKDPSLTPFQRTGTLASLIESRFTLAQDVPTYKIKFADDLGRVQKLRREAIGHAKNDADRQSIIKLLTY